MRLSDMFYENMSDLEIDFLVSAEKWKERCLSLNNWNDTEKKPIRKYKAEPVYMQMLDTATTQQTHGQ